MNIIFIPFLFSGALCAQAPYQPRSYDSYEFESHTLLEQPDEHPVSECARCKKCKSITSQYNTPVTTAPVFRLCSDDERNKSGELDIHSDDSKRSKVQSDNQSNSMVNISQGFKIDDTGADHASTLENTNFPFDDLSSIGKEITSIESRMMKFKQESDSQKDLYASLWLIKLALDAKLTTVKNEVNRLNDELLPSSGLNDTVLQSSNEPAGSWA